MTQGLIAGIYSSLTRTQAKPTRGGLVEQVRARFQVAKNYAYSYRLARQQVGLFDDIRNYCLFVGHARSGGSLVGGLLDAHPNAVIADEVDIFPYLAAMFSREQIFHILLERARHQAEMGRSKAGREKPSYSYRVPGQWQGDYDQLLVIGNRKAGISTQQIRRNPEMIDHLRTTLGERIGLKIILTIRNPFDTISTMNIRSGRDLQTGTQVYFSNCATIEQMQKDLPEKNFLVMRHENLLAEPENQLRSMCEFLEIPAQPDYLKACASILYSSPAKSRANVHWPAEQIRAVSAQIEQYAFLTGYSFKE